MSDDLVPAILWCDLETTGLDAKTGVILEIGLRVTDWKGDEIARWTHPIWDYRWRAMLASNEFVWSMHRDSGLVADLIEIDNQSNADRNQYLLLNVIKRALAWLAEHAPAGSGPHDGKFPMAGNSLGGVDRPFLREHAPAINDWFSYRNLDISSIREACRIVNRALFARMEEASVHPSHQLPVAHRPQLDIDNSIVLWNSFIDNFFWTEEDFLPLER